VLEKQLTSGQYCAVPGKSIFEAVSVLRDVIAQAEVTPTPVCVLSLDFRHAFYRISQYIFQILQGYEISPWFIDRIRSVYEHATATLKINGALAGPIPIQCAIRQACPLSMALYALSVHPLLGILENRLTGVTIGRRGQKISVVAYADDITVLLTHRKDIEIVKQAIQTYERAAGAQLNPAIQKPFL
jgi:hypothetical protein